MSHLSELRTKLDNLFYIQKGLSEMNIKFEIAKEGEKLTTNDAYGHHQKVDILVTEIDGKPTEAIGLLKENDGTYKAVGDFYGVYNQNQFVADLTVAAKQAEATERLGLMNFTLEQNTSNKDEVQLVYSRWV